EGIVAKRLDAPYQAGARGFHWIKLKRSYKGELSDTIDVVVVGYFRGRGMRAKFGIGALLGAVYDRASDTFKTVAKIGSGLSEEEWVRIRSLLDQIRVEHRPARVDSLIEPDVWTEPRYVLTVLADEITRSPVHTCGKVGDEPGYALRFPRVMGWIREDKGPEDATTVEEILSMFQMQRRVQLAG
ncbi:MAG: DNA ligase, partial [Thermoflexus sp.]